QAHPPGARFLEIHVHVAPHVEHQRLARFLGSHEVRRVPEALEIELFEDHVALLAQPFSRPPWRPAARARAVPCGTVRAAMPSITCRQPRLSRRAVAARSRRKLAGRSANAGTMQNDRVRSRGIVRRAGFFPYPLFSMTTLCFPAVCPPRFRCAAQWDVLTYPFR